MPEVTLVIPCFNEARRLRREAIAALLADPRVDVLLVDDGSADGTLALLNDVAASAPRVRVLALGSNAGKAEAVRTGLVDAMARGASAVGYVDADFATPPEEILRLVERRSATGACAVLGCRLARLGADIRRRPLRHYLGRVFATLASWAVDAVVYDTQCGAKIFAVSDELRRAASRPFASRWAFDVELLGRLMNEREASELARHDGFLEVPLERWSDVSGSKLRFAAALRTLWDVVSIGFALRRERRAATRGAK